jgi:hypothetical protein
VSDDNTKEEHDYLKTAQDYLKASIGHLQAATESLRKAPEAKVSKCIGDEAREALRHWGSWKGEDEHVVVYISTPDGVEFAVSGPPLDLLPAVDLFEAVRWNIEGWAS